MSKRLLAAAGVAGVLLGGAGAASPSLGAVQPSGGMPSMLDEDDPQVGEAMPDVTAYTVGGEPVELRGLEGKFKVIVFGCLT